MTKICRASAIVLAVGMLSCSDEDKGPSGDAGLDGGDAAINVKDSDGDGISDWLERPAGHDADTDRDGTPNHLDEDDDGDGIPTKDESDIDSDNDAVPDYLDEDDDNDGVPTKDELKGGSPTDTDGDGVWDHLQFDPPENRDGGMMTNEDCVQTGSDADLTKRPVDIVFIIDNSSSMASEIQAVQNSINTNFAGIIGGSGIDFRVIMLADFGHYDGGARSVCISGTLNPGQSCPADANDPVYGMAPVVNTGVYYQYDVDGATHSKDTSVGSLNSLCRALEWIDTPDAFGLAPNGWGGWLRADALKVFVEVTDDRANCSADLDGDGTDDFVVNDTQDDPASGTDVAGEWQAITFDTLLLQQSPAQFGTASARNYVWHSLVSLPAQAAPNAEQPYAPTTAIQGANCASGENPGRAYEGLSRLTGGMRYPVCAADQAAAGGSLNGFDSIFNTIAQGVVQGSKVECDFPIPDPPAGETIDRATVEAIYTPGGNGTAEAFRSVAKAGDCAMLDDRFYFDGDSIVLCPGTCTRVQADMSADIQIRFGCTLKTPGGPIPPIPDGPVID